MKVAVVKYSAGNVQSVLFALQRLGVEAVWTDSPDEIESADRVIFPGVGEARSAMASLEESGVAKVLPQLKQPFLGICLGLQLMCRTSEEGNTRCLGIFESEVKRFPPAGKVPHMGWNLVAPTEGRFGAVLSPSSYLYFVHSYYVPIGEWTVASCQYTTQFSAALERRNFLGVQFHPEKSGVEGEKILNNFLER